MVLSTTKISSFTKPGMESVCLMYWNNDEYYGVGAGASGYVNGVRYRNRAYPALPEAIAEDGHAGASRGAFD